MIIQATYHGNNYQCDLSKPIDISIPLGEVRCFNAPDLVCQPYSDGSFVGAVKEGAPVNFYNVSFNPNGNGTHTECLGHITAAQESVHHQLKQFHFFAIVISLQPETIENGDQVITLDVLLDACPVDLPEALIIRTLPNLQSKLNADYSGSNPPYLEHRAMEFIAEQNVKHLLIDLPSVDGGKLLSHRLFWKVDNQEAKDETRKDCTITELIFVSDEVEDGFYLLNIQIPSLNLDAAPSKPVLYKLNKIRSTLH